MQNVTDPAVQALLLAIASAQFPSVETFEVRGLDGLDFHDCSIVGIRRALEAAFALGQQSVKPAAKPARRKP